MIRDFATELDGIPGVVKRQRLNEYHYDPNAIKTTEKTQEFKARKRKKKAVK